MQTYRSQFLFPVVVEVLPVPSSSSKGPAAVAIQRNHKTTMIDRKSVFDGYISLDSDNCRMQTRPSRGARGGCDESLNPAEGGVQSSLLVLARSSIHQKRRSSTVQVFYCDIQQAKLCEHRKARRFTSSKNEFVGSPNSRLPKCSTPPKHLWLTRPTIQSYTLDNDVPGFNGP